MTTRQEIFKYVKDKFDTEPDYPWVKSPYNAVLRHANGGKWYGLVINIPRNKIGLKGDDRIDILNIKCETEFISFLRGQDNVFPAYHMSKEHWVSMLLDDYEPKENIYRLLDSSYNLTK